MCVTLKELIDDGIAEDTAKMLIEAMKKAKKDYERLQKELYETPEETVEIDNKIKNLQKRYPDTKILSDGSVVVYDHQQNIGVRHKRKDLLISILVNSKCISCQVQYLNVKDEYQNADIVYYQPLIENEKSVGEVSSMSPRSSKWDLDFSLSYYDAVNLIKHLNKRNPDKEFYLENF